MKAESAAENLCMFLTGAALGAAAALLLAPQSGRKMRRQLRRKVDEAQDYLADVGEELTEKGRDIRGAADDAVRALGKKVKTFTG